MKNENELREFEIWVSGYVASGQRATARMIGKGTGTSFDEAVEDYMSKNPKHGIEKECRNYYSTEEDYINRKINWNIWRCGLYDNETDARKSHG